MFSGKRTNPEEDVCGCCVGGFYPNGLVSLLVAQILLLLGIMLSGASVADCRFVVADVFAQDIEDPLHAGLIDDWNNNSRTGFGFLAFQNYTGSCSYSSWAEDESGNSDDGSNATNIEVLDNISEYVDWLGNDWEKARTTLFAGVCGALTVFVWSLTMICVAHTRKLRIFVGLLPVMVVMPLQLASMSVLGSNFCNERNCTLNRSGVASICAGVLYFAAAMALFLTKNYSKREGNESDNDFQGQQTSPEQGQEGDDMEVGVEMVDIVDDASFVIEGSHEPAHAGGGVEEVIIGDGLAEAHEIKPEPAMFVLPDDPGTGAAMVLPAVPSVVAASAATSASAPDEIPTVTDVQLLSPDDESKTKVAP